MELSDTELMHLFIVINDWLDEYSHLQTRPYYKDREAVWKKLGEYLFSKGLLTKDHYNCYRFDYDTWEKD